MVNKCILFGILTSQWCSGTGTGRDAVPMACKFRGWTAGNQSFRWAISLLITLSYRNVICDVGAEEWGLPKPPYTFGTGTNFSCDFYWTVGRPNWTSMMYRWWLYPNWKSRWRPYTGSRWEQLRSQLLYKAATEISRPNRHFRDRGTQWDSCSHCAMSA